MNSFPANDTVICFGHDEILRKTRQWLLERTGYNVIPVGTISEFRQRICEQAVGLVVLCHTLEPSECQQSAAFAEEHRPAARCLALYASQPNCILKGNHVTLDIGDGPGVFIDTVHTMLPQRTQTHP